MPILDVELVLADGEAPPDAVLAQCLADVAGSMLGSGPGRTWVRLHCLAASHYAENGARVDAGDLPAFVTVLHAQPPEGERRDDEVVRLTQALARVLGRAPERVHVLYAPAAAGRQAFGGVLAR